MFPLSQSSNVVMSRLPEGEGDDDDDESIVPEVDFPTLESSSHIGKGQIKDRHFFVDQRLFCGMSCLVGTIDASAVREMNL